MSLQAIVMDDNLPPEVFQVCRLITEGVSVQNGCKELGISTSTFYQALRNSELLEKEYTRARETRADVRFEKLQDLLDEVKAGAIEPHAARVILDAIKWQTGKEKAKVYGDAMIVRGDKDNPIQVALGSAVDVAVQRRQALPVIDVIAERIEVTAPDTAPALIEISE